MCTSPRQYIKSSGLVVLGPCKMCIECRNMRREDFKQRIQFEIMDYNYIASFVTLTYRDDDLVSLLPLGSAVAGNYFKGYRPALDCTLYRPDIAKFCDNMQKRLKRKFGRSGKYIAVGEYGSDNFRTHWHLIYVGLPVCRSLVLDCWKKGLVDVKPVNKGAIRYVLDYIDKQVFTAKALYEEYGDFTPPFAHFSKGIGFNWIERNLKKFDEFGCLTFGESGKKIQLNPYLVEKYGFKKKSNCYPQSVIKYAKQNHISDLDKALKDRSRIMKTKYEHSMVAKRVGLYDSDKIEFRAAEDRYFMKYGEVYEKT